MPDISKCVNKECPLSATCYRFTCEPSDMQSYSDFKPTIKDGKAKCQYYIADYDKLLFLNN